MAWGKPNPNDSQVIDNWIQLIETNSSTLTSLTILSFRKPTPLQFIKLFQSLSSNTYLKELYLSGHVLEKEAVIALSESLKLNKGLGFLSLGWKTFGSSDFFEFYIKGLIEFKGGLGLQVDLSDLNINIETLPFIIQLFQEQTHLKGVNLSCNQLDNLCLPLISKSISNNSNMKFPLSLELSANTLDSIKDFFVDFNNLFVSELNFFDISIKSNEICTILNLIQNNQHLKKLRISAPNTETKPLPETDISDYSIVESILNLNTEKSNLETLTLSGFNLGQTNLDKEIYHTNPLKELTLRKVGLTDQQFLNILPNLNQTFNKLNLLDLGSNHLTDLSLNSLNENNIIMNLVLLDNNISFSSIIENRTKPTWINLKKLDVNINKINTEGLTNLVSFLSIKTFMSDLNQLELAGNHQPDMLDQWRIIIQQLTDIRPDLQITWK